MTWQLHQVLSVHTVSPINLRIRSWKKTSKEMNLCDFLPTESSCKELGQKGERQFGQTDVFDCDLLLISKILLLCFTVWVSIVITLASLLTYHCHCDRQIISAGKREHGCFHDNSHASENSISRPLFRSRAWDPSSRRSIYRGNCLNVS